jgi:hypothetical protein
MPVLATSRTVRSETPTLLVENPFAPGSYRFQLVVVDDSGNESVPAVISVEVQPRPIRDPRIDVVDFGTIRGAGIATPAPDPRLRIDPRRVTPIGPGPIRPLRPGG